jgi:hypothetical protein
MEHVIIGVDPHKLSATIEVVDGHEKLLGSGRFTTDRAGYEAMRKYAGAWPDRVWEVEGSNGAGRPLAQRLLEDGEEVVDVPAKLAAEYACSTPATTARPTPTTPTRSRRSLFAPRLCVCCSSMASSRPCGCSPTAAKRSPGVGFKSHNEPGSPNIRGRGSRVAPMVRPGQALGQKASGSP